MTETTVAATASNEALPPVSVYIRTLNEADRLSPVLEAAAKVAREIVVIDSGSKDDTVAIAKAAGARVIENTWPGNGFQKRVGEEACTYDWLLDLDADEVLEDDLIAEIKALFADGEPRETVYQTKLISVPPVGAPWRGFMHAWRNKLYDRRHHRMPASKTWDQLELPKTTSAHRLAGGILHYSFRDLTDISSKYNRSSSARASGTGRRSLMQLRLRVWFGFPAYFIKVAFFRGFIRAGTYGMALAMISAHARWLRDAKMYEAELFRRERSGGDDT
ncbi:MAG: glycosyltransferase family 2 protein [Pseudomonadota bacterium]